MMCGLQVINIFKYFNESYIKTEKEVALLVMYVDIFEVLFGYINIRCTVCPRSLAPFYIGTYCITVSRLLGRSSWFIALNIVCSVVHIDRWVLINMPRS